MHFNIINCIPIICNFLFINNCFPNGRLCQISLTFVESFVLRLRLSSHTLISARAERADRKKESTNKRVEMGRLFHFSSVVVFLLSDLDMNDTSQ